MGFHVEFLKLTEHTKGDMHYIERDHALAPFLLFRKIRHVSSSSTVKKRKTLQVAGKCN